MTSQLNQKNPGNSEKRNRIGLIVYGIHLLKMQLQKSLLCDIFNNYILSNYGPDP